MKAYLINELERLTGIKAHTIRIWEKRYGLIAPERTTTNRRYYSDDQVRKLLNVTTLLANGYKISRIATLSEGEINDEVQKEGKNDLPGNTHSGYTNALVKSMISFDEAAFEKVFAAAVARLGLQETMLRVIYPFLTKVGILWTVDKAEAVQEHFATCIIKRKLMTAIDGLPPAVTKDKKFLLFLPEQEWHEIGLLFADFIIRSSGYETIYLGQNVPEENVHKICKDLKPAYMLLFFISMRPIEEAEHLAKTLSKENPQTTVLVAGNIEVFKDAKHKPRTVTFLENVESLLQLLAVQSRPDLKRKNK